MKRIVISIATSIILSVSSLYAGSDFNLVADAVEYLIEDNAKLNASVAALEQSNGKGMGSKLMNEKLSELEAGKASSKAEMTGISKRLNTLEKKNKALVVGNPKVSGCGCDKRLNAIEEKHKKDIEALTVKIDNITKASVVSSTNERKLNKQNSRLQEYINSRKNTDIPSSK